MKGNKLNEGKSKDNKVSLMSPVGELRRVAEANQQRLQNLELAVANLTSICDAIRSDICSLGLSNRGSFKKVKPEAIDMRRSSSPSLELKGDMLGLQMQQLVQQATALGIIKEPKTNGDMKANREVSKRLVMKNMQAATKNQKRLIQTTESTTEKKMSMKLAGIKNNMGATQPKGARRTSTDNTKATSTAKVSLKSTVKKTKTTISEVYVETGAKRSKETVKGSISNKSSIKNVERVKGSVKLALKANQADNNNSENAVKSSALTVTCSSGTPAKSDPKVRRKWSTTKEIIPK